MICCEFCGLFAVSSIVVADQGVLVRADVVNFRWGSRRG